MSRKIKRFTLAFFILMIFSGMAVAKRTFKECWSTCYQQTCATLGKHYQEEQLWSEIENCEQRCKTDCQVFEDKKEGATSAPFAEAAPAVPPGSAQAPATPASDSTLSK